MAHLTHYIGGVKQPDIDLTRLPELTIGRERSSALWFRERSVSRAHAKLERVADHFELTDLGSHNATYLNGSKLAPHRPYRLHPGDTIKICERILCFYDAPSDTQSKVFSAESVSLVGPSESQNTWSAELDSSFQAWTGHPRAEAERHLQAMMELTARLQGIVGADEVFEAVLQALLAIFPKFDCALAALVDTASAGSSDPRPCLTAVRFREQDSGEMILSRTVLRHVLSTRKAVVSQRVVDDFAASESLAFAQIGSLMSAPLIKRDGSVFGLLQLESRRTQPAGVQSDLPLLVTISLQVSQVLENLQLQEIAAAQAQLQRDLELARKIQFSLMPQGVPELPGYKIQDFYSPMRHVGGDCYSYIQLTDGRLAIVVIDVEGKGVPAALLVAKLASEVQLHFARGLTPLEVLEALNASLLHSSVEKLATMAIVVIDPHAHQMTIVNAGHERPLYWSPQCRSSEVGHAEAGMLLGVLDDLEATEYVQAFEPNGVLVLYTDGITDAANAQDERFGSARLAAALEAAGRTPEEAKDQLIGAVMQFIDEQSPNDDMCLICIQREDLPKP